MVFGKMVFILPIHTVNSKVSSSSIAIRVELCDGIFLCDPASLTSS